jgi:hypothetical protein
MAALSFDDLELVYEQLAVAIDKAGRDQESLFLAKLALMLAQATGDRRVVESAIASALLDLDRETPNVQGA